MQHTEGQADHLEILAARRRRDVSRLRPHVKDDAPLQPRHEEVRALVDDGVLDTGHPVKDDCSGSTLDIVD